MLDPSDGAAWIRALQSAFPWTCGIPHIEDDPSLSHVIVGTIEDRFEHEMIYRDEGQRLADDAEWSRLLRWIEENCPSTGVDDSYVENLVAVSFLEGLQSCDSVEHRQRVDELLPPKMLQTLQAMRAWADDHGARMARPPSTESRAEYADLVPHLHRLLIPDADVERIWSDIQARRSVFRHRDARLDEVVGYVGWSLHYFSENGPSLNPRRYGRTELRGLVADTAAKLAALGVAV